jgi:EAL domain-containing protein (putative c-di-GMP-specific phosphodiesterase class I)
MEPATPADATSSDLTGAAARGELFVMYQPTVHLPGRTLHSFEALVRWQHPTRGLVSPAQFIPQAEASGEIVQIGRFVQNQAARQLSIWEVDRGDRAAPQYVSVNASAVELRLPEYVPSLRAILEEHGVAPERMQIEVTESVFVDDIDVMVDRLNEMKDLGVRLAIDDFGTGYSSLSYLANMPLDVMKIDRSFVEGMLGSERMFAVMRATFMLARGLGLSVIAEGVEGEQQEWLLGALGGDLAQGYLYSKPLSVEDATRLVKGDTSAADPVRPQRAAA